MVGLLTRNPAMTNPRLLDRFTVIRRPEVVSDKGRPQVLLPVKFCPVVGVVTNASPNDLERMPDYDVSSKVLSIVTPFRLQMNSPGSKEDYVKWSGDSFIVKHVDDYSKYGPGFVQALVSSTDFNDLPPGWDDNIETCICGGSLCG